MRCGAGRPGHAGLLWRRPADGRLSPWWPLAGPVLLIAGLALLAGCAPALNWRDVQPEGSGVRLQFPCRTASQQRPVPLAGTMVPLALHACSASQLTWGLAFADVRDPAQVGPALLALRQAAAANIGASPAQDLALRVPGSTPNPRSGRWRLMGHLPDGAPVQMQLAVFAHGTRVYQASVVGALMADDAAETFFGAIRIGR